MGSLFKPDAPAPLQISEPPEVEDDGAPYDPDELKTAKQRVKSTKGRKNRAALRIPLTSGAGVNT